MGCVAYARLAVVNVLRFLQTLVLLACILEVVELLNPFFTLELDPGLLYDGRLDWQAAVLDLVEHLEVLGQVEIRFSLLLFQFVKLVFDRISFLENLFNKFALLCYAKKLEHVGLQLGVDRHQELEVRLEVLVWGCLLLEVDAVDEVELAALHSDRPTVILDEL